MNNPLRILQTLDRHRAGVGWLYSASSPPRWPGGEEAKLITGDPEIKPIEKEFNFSMLKWRPALPLRAAFRIPRSAFKRPG
jgi:hypothetical protein